MANYLLDAIPLFILMANILERSGIIEDIYHMVYNWLGWLKGGLATATVAACTMMAAMAGVVGATEVTMGLIALPQMLNRKYDKFIALGCILAGGTLGILIPPSVMLIVYGMVDNCSIGQLYAGAFLPGFMLAGLYILYITIRCYINPIMGPPVPKEERLDWIGLFKVPADHPRRDSDLPRSGNDHRRDRGADGGGRRGVSGGLAYRDLQTAHEFQKPPHCGGKHDQGDCHGHLDHVRGERLHRPVHHGGRRGLRQQHAPGLRPGVWTVMWIMMGILIFLGCFVDWVGIIMLTVPLFGPIIRKLGFDPVWFGVLFAVNLQMSFLSPPFGMSLFYLKSVAPPEISTVDVWKSAFPFLALQFIGLVLCMYFPDIILWVPSFLPGSA